jgi:gliding motility-associated-like protein
MLLPVLLLHTIFLRERPNFMRKLILFATLGFFSCLAYSQEVVPEDNDPFASDVDLIFFAPNAFTPNNDGTNDVFKIVGPQTRLFELVIWDKWGQEVFRTNNIDEVWTGNKLGGSHFVQDGIYLYRYKASISLTEFVEQQGKVLVTR